MSNQMETSAAGSLNGGLVGVFATLKSQHDEVKMLVGQATADPDRCSELWPQIRRGLLAHELGETQGIYSAMRGHDDTRLFAEHHDNEAGQAKQLIEKLDALDITSGAWRALFDQLAGAVVRHADEEDHQIFPRAQDVLGVDTAKELDAKLLALMQQLDDTV